MAELKNRKHSFWRTLGPGLTTGAADDDPSGLATYSQIGAARGFKLLWVSLFSLPLLGVVGEISARIGLVTGVGLAKNIRQYYGRTVLYVCTFLLVLANSFNIGADLGAMAKATQLLVPVAPFAFLVILFALGSLALQIFIPYKNYSKYLKYLTLVLFVYVLSAFSVNVDWGQALSHTFWPRITFTKEEILLLCAALGTTISPYLFFWQTSQEVEEEVMRGHDTPEGKQNHDLKTEIKDMRTDVWSGALVSNMVMFFIVATCGATLFQNGITNIDTAEQAAQALRPFAGDLTYILFTFGILGTGLLAIPVLAGSASYAVAESFNWPEGLYKNVRQARAFYGVIALAMVLGITLNFIGLHPIRALIYSAVLNGIISPVMIFFLMALSRRSDVMGEHKNRPVTSFLGWGTFALMCVVSVVTLVLIL